MLEKINLDNIKRTDRFVTVQRKDKVAKYERDRLMEKINEKMSRATFIQKEKSELLHQRQLMRQTIDQ